MWVASTGSSSASATDAVGVAWSAQKKAVWKGKKGAGLKVSRWEVMSVGWTAKWMDDVAAQKRVAPMVFGRAASKVDYSDASEVVSLAFLLVA